MIHPGGARSGLVALLAAILVCPALAVVASPALAGEPAEGVSRNAPPGTRTQQVTLRWQGRTPPRLQRRSVEVPGIGALTLHCRPAKVQLSLEADVRDRETQLWIAKYEDKDYGRAVAVKTVRIYRHANARDPGDGGTGNPQHEGLNQRRGVNGVENYGSGYGHGIISQRGSRAVAVGGDALAPVTTFDVDWYWNGFDHPARFRSCRIDLSLVTTVRDPIGVNWHGDDDARSHDRQRTRVPAVGTVRLRCSTGRLGKRLLSIAPRRSRTQLYVEKVQAEGRVEDHVSTRTLVRDPETGLIGPVSIPNNGLLRLFVDNGRRTVAFIVSSVQRTNDPRGKLNACETAMGRFPS